MFIIKSIPHHHTTHQQTANITHSRQLSPLPHPTLTTPPPSTTPPKPLLPTLPPPPPHTIPTPSPYPPKIPPKYSNILTIY